MSCTHCGKELNNDAVVCANCGMPNVNKISDTGGGKYGKSKVNRISLAGFIVALSSLALTALAGIINSIHYTGVNFQFFFLIPLAVSFVLSIIGTAKSKKLKSGKGFGISGTVISGFFMFGTLFYFLFAKSIAKAFFTFVIVFLFPFLL